MPLSKVGLDHGHPVFIVPMLMTGIYCMNAIIIVISGENDSISINEYVFLSGSYKWDLQLEISDIPTDHYARNGMVARIDIFISSHIFGFVTVIIWI
jgi:hypothetical protein